MQKSVLIMEVIPAVDIREGKCVRLTQGKAGSETVYYQNPIDAALYWQNDMGAKRIHFVDLDAAIGLGDNSDLIVQMTKLCTAKIQIGGGIRDIKRALKYIESGADRIVVGTTAVKNPDFIKELGEYIEPKQIIVSLDHIKGKVAVKGWTELTDLDALELGKTMEEKGAGFILYSAVESDGTFNGPDIINTRKMVESVNIPVFAAGGTRNKEDVLALKNAGVFGVIIGKAFYEKKLNFNEVKNI
jgi:phosphoribosylformimino-5-aminoimidazole carboxamide ribotide isomerase